LLSWFPYCCSVGKDRPAFAGSDHGVKVNI
jgi:hypothetical protein